MIEVDRKRIGQGWQYSVYDIGGGRVYKRMHSWLKSFVVIYNLRSDVQPERLWLIPQKINELRQSAKRSKGILISHQIPPRIIGNACYDAGGLNYTQDKATPLRDVLSGLDITKQKNIVDRYVALIQGLLFDFGVIDSSFNVTKNYGLDSRGELILLDIGELVCDQAEIEACLLSRPWEKKYVTHFFPDERIRNYFSKEMCHFLECAIKKKPYK